ncbi:MAG: CpaF family protein [Candidatus Micrarchaeota archaeon]
MDYLRKVIDEAKGSDDEAEPAGRTAEPQPERVLLDQYNDVKIYRERGEPLGLYEIPAPRYRGEERDLIRAIFELATNSLPPEAMLATQAEKRERYRHKVLEIIESTRELNVPLNAKEFYANAVVREMAGFGMLDPLITDDNLEEIMVIGTGRPVYVFHRKHQMLRTNVVFYDDKDVTDLIDRIARNVGRRIDSQSPLLDARLPDGTRVNATMQPISLNGSTITIRKFKGDALSIVDLVLNHTLTPRAAAFLWLTTDGMGALPANVIIAGGTASGKTTTLNALTGFVPKYERIISIEDTAELQLPFTHWVRFEARPPGVEGTGEIDTDTLLKNALRMRPDRIIVGEIRGAEGKTLFTAMNTGHHGAMGTIHSNNSRETLVRLLNEPIGVPEIMIPALNFVVMQQRTYDRRKGLIRRVTEIAEIIPREDGQLPDTNVIFQWDAANDELVDLGTPVHYVQMLARYTGQSKEDLLAELEEREKILAKLAAGNVRSLGQVCKAVQEHALAKKAGKF